MMIAKYNANAAISMTYGGMNNFEVIYLLFKCKSVQFNRGVARLLEPVYNKVRLIATYLFWRKEEEEKKILLSFNVHIFEGNVDNKQSNSLACECDQNDITLAIIRINNCKMLMYNYCYD